MDYRPMELDDTIGMMTSMDYRDRFRAEYFQLSVRLGKLKNMLSMWDKGNLKFKPTCPRSTYTLQVRAMEDYKAVLEARAKIEGVDLRDAAAMEKEDEV